jgi:hypothetical protein
MKNVNMFDISFDCDFVQARYVSYQQGTKNSSMCYDLKPSSIVCKTGNWKRETVNANKKSGPEGRVL